MVSKHLRLGATLPLVAVMLPVLLALAAFAINIAQMESVGTEVQVAVDAAAKAAGRTYATTGDKSLALEAAREAARRNPIGDFVIPINSEDLEYGISDRKRESDAYSFKPADNGNAVRITTNSMASGGFGVKPVFPFFDAMIKIRPTKSAIVTQSVMDVALVVDRSGSMAYGASEVAQYPPAPKAAPANWDFGKAVPKDARWLDLVESVNVFIKEIKETPIEEHISLSVYNDSANRRVSLTKNYHQITNKLNQISKKFDAGGTNIGGGMLNGLKAVTQNGKARRHASRVIILMTDGVHNTGTAPMKAAKNISKSGILLFTITFSDEADQAEMKKVAKECGGEHFHAVNQNELKEAFREIAAKLPTLLTK